MAIDLLEASNELQNISLNNEIFDLVLKEFLSKVEIPLSLEKDMKLQKEKSWKFKTTLSFTSEYIDLF